VQAKDFQMSAGIVPPLARRRTAVAIGWIAGFFAAIVLLGFPLAVPLFMVLYLKLQGREGWIVSLALTAVVWALFYGLFDRLLHLPFPAGWVQQWLGLA
jgi:Na+/proline symporter